MMALNVLILSEIKRRGIGPMDDAAGPIDDTKTKHMRWVVLALSSYILFGTYYAFDIPAALSTLMQQAMGVSDAEFAMQLNVMYAVYSVPNIVLPFVAGWMADQVWSGDLRQRHRHDDDDECGHDRHEWGLTGHRLGRQDAEGAARDDDDAADLVPEHDSRWRWSSRPHAQVHESRWWPWKRRNLSGDALDEDPLAAVELDEIGHANTSDAIHLNNNNNINKNKNFNSDTDGEAGARRLLVVCSALVCGGQLVFALGCSIRVFAAMHAGRALFGVGGEALAVAQTRVAARWFRGRELALALGVNLAVARLGSVLNDVLSPRIALAFTHSSASSSTVETRIGDGSGDGPAIAPIQLGVALAAWAGLLSCVSSLICALYLAHIDAKYSPPLVQIQDPSAIALSPHTTSTQHASLPRISPPSNSKRATHSSPIDYHAVPLTAAIHDQQQVHPSSSSDLTTTQYSHIDHSHTTETIDAIPMAIIASPISPTHSIHNRSKTKSPSPTTHTHHQHNNTDPHAYPNHRDKTHASCLTQSLMFPTRFWLICLIMCLLYATVVPFNTIHSAFLQTKWYKGDPITASQIIGIPDLISAVMVPFVGAFVDRCGHRCKILVICSIAMASVHVFFAIAQPPSATPAQLARPWTITASTPIPALVILGISYAMLITFWPCIPIIVDAPKGLTTALGIATSALNASLAVFPIIVASLVAIDGTYTVTETFFVVCCVVGCGVACVLWVVDTIWYDGVLDRAIGITSVPHDSSS